MKILIPGQYPRSEKLIATTRDYDRGRALEDEVVRAQNEDLASFQKLQDQFCYKSAGLFNWDDLLRPFVEIVEGSKVGALTRFFETNSFWKLLEVSGDARIREDKLEAWVDQYFFARGAIPHEAGLIYTLPFIHLFNEYSNGIPVKAIADVLETVAKKLLSYPDKVLCFFEPCFGWRQISDEDRKIGVELIEKLKKTSKAPIYVYSTFFTLGDEAKHLYELPADGYGIDFYANPLEDVLKNFPKNKHLLAGIINTDTTLIEPKDKMRAFLDSIQNNISKESLAIIPNGPPELVPRQVMDQKVENLKEFIS